MEPDQGRQHQPIKLHQSTGDPARAGANHLAAARHFLAGMEHHSFRPGGNVSPFSVKLAGFLRKPPLHGTNVGAVLREYTSRQRIGWYNC
jgi:hypothetical protein